MKASHLLASTAFVDGAVPPPIVGQVYTTKKCETLASALHGQTGWRVNAIHNGNPVLELVYFYGKISPGKWLTGKEQEDFKRDRATMWWVVNGATERAERFRRHRLLETRMELRTPVIPPTPCGCGM